MERIFIECVKNQPCLWKTDMEDYKMSERKDEAWKKVIKESAISEHGIKTVKEAKYYWKKLRDMHRQSISRQRKVGGTRKWKHQDHMQFILPYLRRANEGLNCTTDADLLKDDTEIDLQDDTSGSTTPTPKQPHKMENIFVHEFNREDSDSGRNQGYEERQVLDTTVTTRPALESFFASMCDMTCSLPEYMQIRVERKIFDVVMEAREEHLQNQTYFGS